MSRKSASAAVAANVVELESAAITAVKSIESSYGAASDAILAYTLASKSARVLPPVFEAGIARIAAAAPGIALISVRGYISNARRIFACPADKFAEAQKAGGTDSIKALAAACPVVSKAKADGQKARAAAAPAAPAAPAVTVSTPASDPILAASNALVAMRKLATGKKKAKLILAAIGEIEDMMQDIKDMMIA